MRKSCLSGFTLVEILLAMSVLLVGLVGILSLFPVGLDATRKAIEDSNAAMIAESVYASLRTAVKNITLGQQPGELPKIFYLHDGINPNPPTNDATIDIVTTTNQSTWIPKSATLGPLTTWTDTHIIDDNNFCQLTGTLTSLSATSDEQWTQWGQYSFNIQLIRLANPPGLYDVIIRIRRGRGNEARIIKKFYTQIAILVN